MFEPTLPVLARSTSRGIELRAPAVGAWRPGGQASPSTLVTPGASVGELEILGVLHSLVVPEGVAGLVTELDSRRAEIPVSYGDVLLVLDPEGTVTASSESGSAAAGAAAGERGLVFESPLSGRFYARPAPGKPAFVSPGDIVSEGQTVGLLEVMKTFNRITYGGSGLPARARVVAIVPEDEADLDAGDPILRLEPA